MNLKLRNGFASHQISNWIKTFFQILLIMTISIANMAQKFTGNSRKILVFLIISATIFMLFNSVATRKPQPGIYPEAKDVSVEKCSTGFFEKIEQDSRPIYFVTPTYTRREQIVEMTRLGQTLLHIKNVVWIVAEDTRECTPLVESILARFQIPYVHLASPMPEMYKELFYKPRGVANRNAGVEWIKGNVPEKLPDGVLYFGDDDNTYDLRLFDEIRRTKKISMFPVAFIGDDNGISSPLVGKDDKVVGFTDPWFADRKYPVDMAGFAVDTGLLRKSDAVMAFKAGHEEDLFIQSLGVETADIEPLADGCTKILVWHTKTQKAEANDIRVPEETEEERGGDSSLRGLLKFMTMIGIYKEDQDKGLILPTCFFERCPTKKARKRRRRRRSRAFYDKVDQGGHFN